MTSVIARSNLTLLGSSIDSSVDLQGDIAGSIKQCMIALNQYNSDVTVVKIAKAIGGFFAFCRLPVLPWAGHSKSLENREIRPRNLMGSLMRSKDDLNAPLIALKTYAIPDIPQGEEIFRQTFIMENMPWPCDSYFGKNAFCKIIKQEINIDQFQWEVAGGTSMREPELKLYIKNLA